MTLFFQLLLSGIMMGSIYGLVALGFVLIYKSSQVFNFAVGAMLMLSSYIGYTMLAELQMPSWLGVLAALLVSALIGAALERFPLRFLIGQPILAIIMVTLAFVSIFSGFATLFWGGRGLRGYPPSFMPAETIHLGGVAISEQRLWAFAISMALAALFAIFFKYTRAGLNMRATAEGHKLAQSTGIRVNTVIRISWIIAAIVCAAGGILLGAQRGVSFSLADIGLKAFPAALVGGLESLPGALLGGILIGVVEALLSGYIGGGIGEIGAFIIMMLVLVMKPYGLFGLKIIERL